ncbi:MAG: hypothetical protein RR471_08050 [Bacteroides sp.]
MTLQQQLKNIENELIANLCAITDTSKLLPHTVFVEEDGENAKGEGVPVYNQYTLTAIHPDGSCTLLNPTTGENETGRHLSEINIDWLITLWNWHKEQQDVPVIENCDDLEKAKPSKELFAFLYPIDRFDRTATDETIVADYDTIDTPEPKVEKLTPDALAERVNDDSFNDQKYWIRFLKA